MKNISIWKLCNAALDILETIKENYKFFELEASEEERANFNDAYYTLMHWNNRFHDEKMRKRH